MTHPGGGDSLSLWPAGLPPWTPFHPQPSPVPSPLEVCSLPLFWERANAETGFPPRRWPGSRTVAEGEEGGTPSPASI